MSQKAPIPIFQNYSCRGAPWKCFARPPPSSIGAQGGPASRFTGRLALGGDEGHAHSARGLLSCEPPGSSAFVAQQIGHHRLLLGVWPCLNKLSHSSLHKQLFPQTAPIVGTRFLDLAHYNEFVENGSKSWTLMRRWLVLGVKNTQNRAAQRPREKGPHVRGQGCANPSRSHKGLLPFSGPLLPFSCEIFVVIYPSLMFILLIHLPVIHAHPRVHIPSAILSGTLWAVVAPLARSKGHIHINSVRVLAFGI